MDYKSIIESKYNRIAWQELLHDIFRGKVQFWNTPSSLKISGRLAKEAFYLGKVSLSDGESIAVYEVELSDNVDIVRNKHVALKPMDAEEAVLQMDMLGHDFYVFTDADSNGTHVVYRRTDGRYGLIETE